MFQTIKNSKGEIMFSFLNRAEAYLNTKVRYVVKEEEHALEKKNTIVVPHKKTSIRKSFKQMVRKFKND